MPESRDWKIQMTVLDSRLHCNPHLFSYPVNVHGVHEVGHISIQERGSPVTSIAATVNSLHPKYKAFRCSGAPHLSETREHGRAGGRAGHGAARTTTASAALPVPPHGTQIAQQLWIQQSYFLRQCPLQEFHLISHWGTVWAASLTAWH